MRKRVWLGLVLAAVLAVAGVQGVANAFVKPAPAHTAAEYFDGIYFAVGPVADRLPQLHESRSPADEAGAAEVAEQVREHIDAQEPRFLGQFAKTIVSGDRVAIRAALLDGARKMADAYRAVYPNGSDAMPVVCGPTGCVVGIAIAVAITVIIWIAVHIAEALTVGTVPQGDDPDLMLDHVVDVIATQLKLG